MFITGTQVFQAFGNKQSQSLLIYNLQFPDGRTSPDTTNTQEPIVSNLVRHNNLSKNDIDFQINSEIVYLNTSQFKNPEAKKMFLQAIEKEGKLEQVVAQADSLRKIYTAASDEQKDEIAAKILRLEQQTMELNSELPDLYEQVRRLENEFWGKASVNEKTDFQEKVKNYRDSIQQIEQLKNNKTSIIDKNIPDTIDFYPIDQKNVSKAEPNNAVVYKIQIGAYKGRLPDSTSKLIKKLSVIRKIDNSKDEKGMTIYTTGNLKTYKEAATMQAQVKQEGVKNATITAYKNGKKIAVDEAKKISNEL